MSYRTNNVPDFFFSVVFLMSFFSDTKCRLNGQTIICIQIYRCIFLKRKKVVFNLNCKEYCTDCNVSQMLSVQYCVDECGKKIKCLLTSMCTGLSHLSYQSQENKRKSLGFKCLLD